VCHPHFGLPPAQIAGKLVTEVGAVKDLSGGKKTQRKQLDL